MLCGTVRLPICTNIGSVLHIGKCIYDIQISDSFGNWNYFTDKIKPNKMLIFYYKHWCKGKRNEKAIYMDNYHVLEEGEITSSAKIHRAETYTKDIHTQNNLNISK